MPIAFISDTAGGGTGTGATVSVAIDSATTLLLVSIHWDNDTETCDTVTFNSVGLTRVTNTLGSSAGGIGDCRVELFQLVNPDITTANVVVTLSGAETKRVHCMQFSGIDTASPVANGANGGGDGNTTTISVTGMTAGDLAVMVLSGEDGDAITASDTVLFTDDTSLPDQRGRSDTTTTTAVFDVGSAGQWAAGAVRLVQSPAFLVNVNDAITISESVTGPDRTINPALVFDAVTIADVVTQLQRTSNPALLFDAISITENSSAAFTFNAPLTFDAISITDTITGVVVAFATTVFEEVFITEDASGEKDVAVSPAIPSRHKYGGVIIQTFAQAPAAHTISRNGGGI